MKRYLVDTNALISFVTDRNTTQQEFVAPLFEAAAAMKCRIICPLHVLSEFVFVLERVYKVPKSTIRAIAQEFMHLPGVEICRDVDCTVLFQLWPDQVADFGDAVVAVVGKAMRGVQVVTFDERFAKELRTLGVAVFE